MLASAALCGWLLAAQAPAPLFEQGARAFAAGEFEKAEALLSQAVNHDPRSFEVRFLLGATLVERHRTAEAIAQLREAHRLNPRHADALIVNLKHDAHSFAFRTVEDLHQDEDDEFHRRVIVVVEQHFVQRRLFQPLPGFGQRDSAGL